MSLHMIGVKQIFLWAGWCVVAFSNFLMKWCPEVDIFLVKISSMVQLLFPLLRAYPLPPTRNRFRPKKDSRLRKDGGQNCASLHWRIHSWSTTADSCPPSDFSDRPPVSISMTTGRKWLTWNRSIYNHKLRDDFSFWIMHDLFLLFVSAFSFLPSGAITISKK